MTELLEELEQKFTALRKELKFKATFEQIDEIFFLKDYIQDKGFVSEKFSRMLCARMVDLYMSWYGYLHSLIMPSASSMASMTESHLFNEAEKQEIAKVKSRIMSLSSRNAIVGLTKDKQKEAEFIDAAVDAWPEINAHLIRILTRVNEYWSKPKAISMQKPDMFH